MTSVPAPGATSRRGRGSRRRLNVPLAHLHDVHPLGLIGYGREPSGHEPSERLGWRTLIGVALFSAAAAMDMTIVNVAVPTIQSDLGGGLADLQWVIGIFALAYAVVLVPAGRLGDVLGPRRVWLVGVSVYSVGVAASAVAPSTTVLIAARALAGVGAGLASPAAYALIAKAFDRKRRGRALGRILALIMFAAAFGPFTGGLVIATVGWRGIFVLTLPLAALAMITIAGLPREERRRRSEIRLAPLSTLLLAISVASLAFAMIESRSLGLYPVGVGAVGLSMAAAAVFWLIERDKPVPFIDARLLKDRVVAASVLASVMVSFGFFGTLFYLLLYLQAVGGLSALQAGLVLVPGSLIGIAASPLVGRAADRWRPEWILPLGLAVIAASLIALSALDSESSIALHVLPGLILNGLGFAMVSIPSRVAVLNAVTDDRVGRATSLISVSAKLSAGLGVAAASALFHAFSAGNVEQSLGARGVSVGNALFNRIVERCLGVVDVHPHLERVVDSIGGAGTPSVTALEQVVDESFLMTLGNTYLVGTGLVVLGTVIVVWLLRSGSHDDWSEEPATEAEVSPGSDSR